MAPSGQPRDRRAFEDKYFAIEHWNGVAREHMFGSEQLMWQDFHNLYQRNLGREPQECGFAVQTDKFVVNFHAVYEFCHRNDMLDQSKESHAFQRRYAAWAQSNEPDVPERE